MIVNIEFVNWLYEQRKKINSVPLSEIEWYEDGQKLEFTQKKIDDFEYTGLINTDFIGTDCYRTEERE